MNMELADKVTIIIPIFNGEKYLGACIESCMNQTYKNLEILCIDDGSMDQSAAIIDGFAQRDTRVIPIHKNNEGVSQARNIGIEKSTGDWIVFVDADDYIHPTFVEKFFAYAQSACVDVVIGSYIVDKKGVCTRIDFTAPKYQTNICEMIENVFCKSAVIWGKMIRKEVFREIRFDKQYAIGEDGLVLLEVMLSWRCGMLKEALYYYRIQEGGVTAESLNEKAFNGVESSMRLAELMLKYNRSLRHIAEYRVQRSILWLLNKCKDKNKIKQYSKQIEFYRNATRDYYHMFIKNRFINFKQHYKLLRFYGIL